MDSVGVGLLAGGVLVGCLILFVVGWCLYVLYWRKKCCGSELGWDDDTESEHTRANVEAAPLHVGKNQTAARTNQESDGEVSKKKAEKMKQGDRKRAAVSLKRGPVLGSPLLEDNPLFNEQEFQFDFDNPTYDREHGSKFDACVKIQTVYRGYKQRAVYKRVRSAVLTIQRFVRGFIARRRTAKYKVQKEHLKREGQLTMKRRTGGKSGYLKGLALFDAKSLGSTVVPEARGEAVVQEAISTLKKQLGGRRKKRVKISVSPHGIKLFDAASMTQLDHIRITTVSYCSVDPKQNKVFAFIERRPEKCICYVFHCTSNNADELAKTVSEAYSLVYQRVQKVREHKAKQTAAIIAAKQAAEEAKRLEDDLDVRLEELEEDFADLHKIAQTTGGSKFFNYASMFDDFDESGDDLESATSSEDEEAIPRSSTKASLFTKSRATLDDFAATPMPLKRAQFQEAMTEIEVAGEPVLDEAIARFLRGDDGFEN